MSSSELLTGTGQGPFIEIPEFKAIGTPSNVLNVKLPQSSNLNIKLGATIAMNGDLTNINIVNRKLGNMKYQILQSQAPASLLIGGRIRSNCINNYCVVDINAKDDQWTILDDSSIVAWSGYDLELQPVDILKKWSSYKTTGKGRVVLSGNNSIFTVNIQPGEKMLINPTSLIAANGDFRFRITPGLFNLPKFTSPFTMPKFKIPKLSLTSSLKMPKLPDDAQRYITRTKYFFQNTGLFIKLSIIQAFKPVFIEVLGPCDLLISTNSQVPNRLFLTKQEINSIRQS